MRVRVRFTKQGKVRFVSHRDLARIWERALRRAELPVAYSVGFSPRPRFHFGLALSVGHESWAEYLDVDLVDAVDLAVIEALPERFSAVLPEGVQCCLAAAVDSADTLSLQEAVTSSTWSIEIEGGSPAEAEAALHQLNEAPSLIFERERKGKITSDDIRPYVRCLYLDADASQSQHGVVLRADLGTQPRALRPAELIKALGPQWQERRVCRLAQWIDHEGERREPLAQPVGSAPWARTPSCAT